MRTLATHLDNYLKLRRQLGFKLRVQGFLLRQFVGFAEQMRTVFITTKLALGWATAPPQIQPLQKANRLSTVRSFARYVSAFDRRTEIPPQRVLPYHFRRRDPYLYRPEEVFQLVEAARQIDPAQPNQGAALSTLIGLLAVSGMRVGEAIGLDRDDVDLSTGVVIVRHAKGDKTRLVPLHPSAQQALQRYAALRDGAFPRPASSSFFVSARGTRLLYSTVNRSFLIAARQVGLRQSGHRCGPRLHDLRHLFATQTLLCWYRSTTDVEAHLPELSTYLGHAHVRDTYWYLTAVPELLQLATRRCQRKEAQR